MVEAEALKIALREVQRMALTELVVGLTMQKVAYQTLNCCKSKYHNNRVGKYLLKFLKNLTHHKLKIPIPPNH